MVVLLLLQGAGVVCRCRMTIRFACAQTEGSLLSLDDLRGQGSRLGSVLAYLLHTDGQPPRAKTEQYPIGLRSPQCVNEYI